MFNKFWLSFNLFSFKNFFALIFKIYLFPTTSLAFYLTTTRFEIIGIPAWVWACAWIYCLPDLEQQYFIKFSLFPILNFDHFLFVLNFLIIMSKEFIWCYFIKSIFWLNFVISKYFKFKMEQKSKSLNLKTITWLNFATKVKKKIKLFLMTHNIPIPSLKLNGQLSNQLIKI